MDRTPPTYRSLASKFSIFTGGLVLWVVASVLLWDIRGHTFDWAKGAVLVLVVAGVAAGIGRFTSRLLARPLKLLQDGITSVQQGRLEPIQVSRTGDEIEYLGESFNKMIGALAASEQEVRENQELLEDRIRQRTAELEKAMHAALDASHAKSEFLANMSHELRTPMNGLLGMLDLALDSPLPNEQKEQLEIAQRCAYSLLSLLNDILDLSKIEAGKMVLERIPYNPRVVVDDCLKANAHKAESKGIQLRVEADPATSHIAGDPLRFRQIVANLVSNAVKFTERGSVAVQLELRGTPGQCGELLLVVSDTGPGIPTDKMPLIFDKFTQADTSISRKYGGTGLGLAITQRLVELHAGKIGVSSRVGGGSRFWVRFPCELAAEPAPVHDAVRAAPAARSGSIRLLLAEDNLVNQKVVLAALRKTGYHIDVALDGREAITLLEAAVKPYDLVLMDVQMPVLDGLEATRLIRKNPRWDAMPIMAMTAHAMSGDRERCLNAGMNAYMAKPVQPARLVAMIDKMLGQHPSAPAPSQPAQSNGSAFERVLVDRLMREDAELLSGMLALFLQLAPERLATLQAAAEAADIQTLNQEAGMIVAAASQLALGPLGDRARRIQDLAANRQFIEVQSEVAELRTEIQSLEALV